MGRSNYASGLVMSCVLLLAPFSERASASDLAERTPEGAVVYVGWSGLLKALSLDDVDPQAVVKMMTERFDMPNSEKEPAGRLIEALITAAKGSGGLSVFVSRGAVDFDVQFAVLIDAGEQNALLEKHLDVILPAIAEEAATPSSLEGVSLRLVPVEGAPLYWGSEKNVVVLAYGADAAKQVAATLKGAGKPLTESAEFKLARSKAASGTQDRTLCVFADLGKLRIGDMLAVADGGPGAKPTPEVQKLFDALGVESFRSLYWQLEPTAYGSRSRALLRTEGAARGLAKIGRQKPLSDADLEIIARDAYWGTAFNFDLNGAWLEAREVMTAVDPNLLTTVDGGLAMVQGFLGFSPTEHLLPALGDTWVVYDAPSHGGLLFTGAVLVGEVRDATAIDGIAQRVIELSTPLAKQADVALALKSHSHAGHKIQYVVIGGVPSPVAPSWALVGDRVVFGLTPQTVAAALAQVDAKARQGSILEHPDYQSVRASLPKEFSSFSCGDSAYMTRQLYPLLLHALIAGRSFMAPYMPADIASLPGIEEKVKTARLSLSVSTWTADGLYSEGVGPGDLLSASGGSVAATALGVSVLLPSLSRAREQARFVQSMSQLKQIGMAVHMYAADHSDKLPGSLEELLEGNLLMREALGSPFDEPGAVSYTYVPYGGKRISQFERPSETVLAFEHDPGGRTDVALLFLDGHVRRVPFWDARPQVQMAYESAGATAQLPERWR